MGVFGWALGLLPLLLLLPGVESQTQACSVVQKLFSVEENTLPIEALATVTAPPGQTVVVSDSSSPKDIFNIVDDELRLTRAPDYETHSVLLASLECQEGSTVVTRLHVIVEVLNVNDMAPVFPFSSKAWNVSENTEVGTTVIASTELTATDEDGDTLFYSLSGQSPPDADLFFSLAGVNFPALQLAQDLDYGKNPIMVFHLLARDTLESEVESSHTATATVIVQVVPADMRPPWFLPCLYTDGQICIHAQYQGAVSTGSVLTSPLIFEPGPVYAIDGDTAINEQIGYSIIGGNTDDTFQIGLDSGNITMAKAVPSPKTFNLLVQAQQQVHTRSYSVTQVTIEAVASQLYPPRFPQALYRGWLPPGTGINVAVKDAEDTERELRLRAEDDDFPAGVPNSGLQYRITNSLAFRMSGEVVWTNDTVGPPQVLYLEAEVLDEVTSEKDTTTIEILVQFTPPESTTQGSTTQTSPTSRSTPTILPTQYSPKPSSPGTTLVPPEPSVSSTTSPGPTEPSRPTESTTQGSTTQTSPTSRSTPTTSPTQYSPKPSSPGTTLVPPEPNVSSTTSPGPIGPSRPTESTTQGSTTQTSPTSRSTPTTPPTQYSPKPSSPGTTLVPPEPSVSSTTSPGPTEPSRPTESTTQGSTTQTSPTSRSTPTTSPTQYSPKPSSPGTTLVPPEPNVSSTTSPGPIGPSRPTGGSPGCQEQQRSTVNEMAILGGVLGALLFLTLVLLGVFIYKSNGCHKYGLSSKHGADFTDSGYDNKTFQAQEPSNWAALASPSPEPGPVPQPLKDDLTGEPSYSPASPPEVETLSPEVREAKEEEKGEAQDEESLRTSKEGPVRSILTKEHKSEEGGYKAVWFQEDIGAQVDVVIINSPVPEEPQEPQEHVVEPEEPEELQTASIEPELVLVVSEEPEELLMASVEPQLLLVVPEEEPKEPEEPVVVPELEVDQSSWKENKCKENKEEELQAPANCDWEWSSS